MSKIKFSSYQPKQSRIVEGVCVPISYGLGDYDELLREAVRVALRMDMNPARDDWDDLRAHWGPPTSQALRVRARMHAH
jgi:hypothetical protein